MEEACLDIEVWNPLGFLESQGCGLRVMVKEGLLEIT